MSVKHPEPDAQAERDALAAENMKLDSELTKAAIAHHCAADMTVERLEAIGFSPDLARAVAAALKDPAGHGLRVSAYSIHRKIGCLPR